MNEGAERSNKRQKTKTAEDTSIGMSNSIELGA